jgi:uncharacterized protein (TIGR03084 family)
MTQLVADLAAEQDALDDALCTIPAARWEMPSPAQGWLLRDCIAHLAEVDETAAQIAESGAYPEPSGPKGDGVRSGRQLEARALPVPELLDWWRSSRHRMNDALRPLDPKQRLPWVGPPMSVRSFTTARLMECWSHGLDALAAAELPAVDTDRLRHIAHLGVITREFAYRNRGLEPPDAPLRVDLVAPSGATWRWGPDDATDRISGAAGEFCRVVTQRIHPADTALQTQGAAAAEFLTVAQAFAGPPGAGRAPRGGEFNSESR